MSCLFNSLFPFIPCPYKGTITSPHKLREYLCEYLEGNPELIKDLPFHTAVNDPQAYISRMRLPSTWGGAIEILAFANCFHSAVIVYSKRAALRTQLFIPLTRLVKGEASITYDGGHYEPFMEKKSFR